MNVKFLDPQGPMREIFRRPYRGTLFVPANRLSSPNDRAESLLLTSISKLNLSATFYSRESLRYCPQGLRREIPIVLDNHDILYPGPIDLSLTLNDIEGTRGLGEHQKASGGGMKGYQSKKAPCSRRLIVKLYSLFEIQDLESHTLFSGTYTHRPNKGVSPPPLRGYKLLPEG